VENYLELGRPQMTTWRMRVACWITKATDTLSENAIYCFYNVTMAARTRLNVMLYVH